MKILICSDGSARAEKATRLAAGIAAGCEAKVALLGVTESPGDSESLLDALKRSKQILDDRKVESELINKSGEPIEQIVKWTTEVKYDLVIIGAERKGRRGPFWMSAKAYKIIKSIKPPVLIAMGEAVAIKRILICSGGKKYIEGAVSLAGRIAQGLQAQVTLFHVMPEAPMVYSDFRRAEEDVELVLNSTSELGRNLRKEKETLASLGVAVEVRLRQGIVLKEIFREIRQGKYDLVVTGSSLSTGSFQTYVMGDVTREIVNRSNLPVLVVRSDHQAMGFRASLKSFIEDLTGSFRSAKPDAKKL